MLKGLFLNILVETLVISAKLFKSYLKSLTVQEERILLPLMNVIDEVMKIQKSFEKKLLCDS